MPDEDEQQPAPEQPMPPPPEPPQDPVEQRVQELMKRDPGLSESLARTLAEGELGARAASERQQRLSDAPEVATTADVRFPQLSPDDFPQLAPEQAQSIVSGFQAEVGFGPGTTAQSERIREQAERETDPQIRRDLLERAERMEADVAGVPDDVLEAAQAQRGAVAEEDAARELFDGVADGVPAEEGARPDLTPLEDYRVQQTVRTPTGVGVTDGYNIGQALADGSVTTAQLTAWGFAPEAVGQAQAQAELLTRFGTTDDQGNRAVNISQALDFNQEDLLRRAGISEQQIAQARQARQQQIEAQGAYQELGARWAPAGVYLDANFIPLDMQQHFQGRRSQIDREIRELNDRLEVLRQRPDSAQERLNIQFVETAIGQRQRDLETLNSFLRDGGVYPVLETATVGERVQGGTFDLARQSTAEMARTMLIYAASPTVIAAARQVLGAAAATPGAVIGRISAIRTARDADAFLRATGRQVPRGASPTATVDDLAAYTRSAEFRTLPAAEQSAIRQIVTIVRAKEAPRLAVPAPVVTAAPPDLPEAPTTPRRIIVFPDAPFTPFDPDAAPSIEPETPGEPRRVPLVFPDAPFTPFEPGQEPTEPLPAPLVTPLEPAPSEPEPDPFTPTPVEPSPEIEDPFMPAPTEPGVGPGLEPVVDPGVAPGTDPLPDIGIEPSPMPEPAPSPLPGVEPTPAPGVTPTPDPFTPTAPGTQPSSGRRPATIFDPITDPFTATDPFTDPFTESPPRGGTPGPGRTGAPAAGAAAGAGLAPFAPVSPSTRTPSRPPSRPPARPPVRGAGAGKRGGKKPKRPAAYPELVAHKQGFVYKIKNKVTGRVMYTRNRPPGVPVTKGKGSAARSYTVLRRSPKRPTQRTSKMGVMNVKYNGGVRFSRRKKGRR